MSDDSDARARPATGEAAPPPPPPRASEQPPTPATYTSQDTTGSVPVSRPGVSVNLSTGLVAGLVAVVGIVLAIFLSEDGVRLWDGIKELWSIVAIAAAVLTLLPALRGIINMEERQAWYIAAGGAAFLVLWWVLFILPVIGRNTSFLATVATGAAVLATWTSPGNPYKRDTADT